MDIRNGHLGDMIASIFPSKAVGVDIDKRLVIIGKGKYANKCSFLKTDEADYSALIRLTFTEAKTEFVDSNGKEYKGYCRQVAVDHAVEYLMKKGIDLNYTFYSDTEKALFSKLIGHLLERHIHLMCSFGKNFDEDEYNSELKKMRVRHRKEIITKGIIRMIYSSARYSAVEQYKEGTGDYCLLIDNGDDWHIHYNVRYIDTTIKLHLVSEQGTDSRRLENVELVRASMIKNRPVSLVSAQDCRLDFWNLNTDFYVPRIFCFYTSLAGMITAEDESHGICKSDMAEKIGTEYGNSESEIKEMSYRNAYKYLLEKYCSDVKLQYMKKLKAISSIVDSFLKCNYNRFFSDTKTEGLGKGLDQFRLFMEENGIGFSKEDTIVIYKYLLTLWLDKLCSSLELYDFEEMFKLYSESKEYKDSIDDSRKCILKHTTLKILDDAHTSYISFYQKHRELLSEFEKKIRVEADISVGRMVAEQAGDVYSPFKNLKAAIEDFQHRLEWNVPYYVQYTIIEGDKRNEMAKKYIGYGHVGDKVAINIRRDEKYEVISDEPFILKWNDNVFCVTYKLKE